MKLKYTMLSNGHWLYQRRYPKALQGHPQVTKPTYVKSLGVTSDSTDEEVLKAWQSIHTDFETYISTLLLTNTSQLAQADKIRRAEALLKANNLKRGMLADDPSMSTSQNAALRNEALESVEGSGAVDTIVYRTHEQRSRDAAIPDLEPMTAQEEIESIAWQLLWEPKQSASKNRVALISECWTIYKNHKGIDTDSRNGKRVKKRWERLLEIAGDNLLTQDSANDALDAYVQARETEGVKGTSIKRELSDIAAILRLAINKQRLPITITKPEIKNGNQHDERYVLTDDEQKLLLTSIRSSVNEPWKKAALLLMLQSGCITTELQRLRQENIRLNEPVPHILIAGQKTKTAARQRVIPIVLGVSELRELLPFDKQFSEKVDSNVSHQLSTILSKVNPLATAYSLRHTFKNNALAAGIDSATIALLGGWSSSMGVNPIQQQYGAGGRLHEGTLKRLQKTMLKINSHLLEGSAAKLRLVK